MAREEQEKWETVGQCGGRLVEIAQGLFQGEGMKEVSLFKFFIRTCN